MSPSETALERLIRGIHEENLQLARIGCHLIDKLKSDVTPSRLDDVQDFVRLGLFDARRNLQVLQARDKRRSPHFSARIKRKRILGPQLAIHLKALATRIGLYEDRRAILQQIADAAAWIVLHRDIRRTGPLTKPQTHDLPEGAGLIGMIQLKHELHDSGHFLVIENDLTRFIGYGDLTIARRDDPTATPLLVEVKTHAPDGQIAEGASIGILSITAQTSLARDQETVRRFTEVLGSKENAEMIVSERSERQAQDIADRTDLLARLFTRRVAAARRAFSHATVQANLLSRALAQGSAFDVPERDVFYFAARTELPHLKQSLTAIRSSIRAFVGDDVPLLTAVSTEFAQRPDLAGLVTPVALWEVPLELRARVLSVHLILGVMMRASLLEELFSAEGITFTRDGRAWRLAFDGDKEPWFLAPETATAAELAMAFAGLSPRDFVKSVAEATRLATPRG